MQSTKMWNKGTSRIFVFPQYQNDKIRGLMGLQAKAAFPFKTFVRVEAV